MAHLAIRGVSVDYPTEEGTLHALQDVNLSVDDGEAICIIGPSGSGKSTLLQLICGLLTPTQGTVLVNDQPLAGPRKETALILQDFGLLPWKTVYQNAELGLRIRKVPEDERRQRTSAALADVGLADFADRYPSELSGGMKQRLALARSLALDVDLFCMDEPLSALDALLRESLQDAILELWQQRHHTQILVTHSIEEAVYLGQRILVFSERPGRIVADMANPNMGTAGFRDSAAFLEQCSRIRSALATTLTVGDAADAVATDAAQAGDAR